jgi:hypothetical protein
MEVKILEDVPKLLRQKGISISGLLMSKRCFPTLQSGDLIDKIHPLREMLIFF